MTIRNDPRDFLWRAEAIGGMVKGMNTDAKPGHRSRRRQINALWSVALGGCLCVNSIAADGVNAEIQTEADGDLRLPALGTRQLRILTPILLEITWINTKPPDPARVDSWDFVDAKGQLHLPDTSQFDITAEGRAIPVRGVGFKRRVVYAPLKTRDLRIGNYLYLELAASMADGQTITVHNPGAQAWPANQKLTATLSPQRLSPAIHVNQVGYLPRQAKQARVGYYLGSLGELNVSAREFKLIEADSRREVYAGTLTPQPDRGFTFSCYQQVLVADFTKFQQSGEYRLLAPGLGVSSAFWIDDGVLAGFARTYALGLYHQRCGMANELPYTRFIHAPCHTAPAMVPTPAFARTQRFLAEASADYTNFTRHVAPPLKDVEHSLYPFVRQGQVDVSGGHHDAGDYSKYTINSAALIHYLVFAADNFPDAGALDNLGLPESGNGRSDLLEEAKWEADFLAKMQDDDGGFYFLVYPRDRRYEQDRLPDQGDPQVVWPKNTAATAAATAALAQCASSPLFKKQFPAAATRYLAQARKGWKFLQQALSRHGPDGAYQKLTHYGNDFLHDDELAWAACELYLATGEREAEALLFKLLQPAAPATRKWGWWRLYESYGHAIRSYAFAARSGRVKPSALQPLLLAACEAEVVAAGEEQWRRARDCAYGTSFPAESKRARAAGWYFSLDAAFDLAVACQLDYPVLADARPKFIEALLSNLNYEAGCNPVNVCYLTGLGWRRPHEIVHQYAQNDRRVMPPSGLPIGNLQTGFGWLDLYQRELGVLTFPADSAPESPFPLYDRWGDSFNLQTEFVVSNQARGLACLAWLMAQTPAGRQLWKAIPALITGLPPQVPLGGRVTASMEAAGLDLRRARVVWEARNQEPSLGTVFTFAATNVGPQWVEVEAQWPDGRRAFGVTNFLAQ